MTETSAAGAVIKDSAKSSLNFTKRIKISSEKENKVHILTAENQDQAQECHHARRKSFSQKMQINMHIFMLGGFCAFKKLLQAPSTDNSKDVVIHRSTKGKQQLPSD